MNELSYYQNNHNNQNTTKELNSDEYLIIKKQIEEDLATHDFSEPHFSRSDIENILQMKIKNLNHYLRSLVHKSIYKAVKKYSSPKPIQEYLLQHNERLEFLGDSVLGFIVANYLFHKFPENDEGFLTKLKTKIVNSAQLASLAKKINLGNLILMSNHVENIGGRTSQKILEDAFEAFLAAIFKDLGFDAANHFMIRLIDTLDFEELFIETNYKDMLLRYTQNNKNPGCSKSSPATYEVESADGPAHEREYIVCVVINGLKYGQGKAKSKKGAEQIAAEKTLKQLNII